MPLHDATLEDIGNFFITRCIHVAIATVWLWDAIISLPPEAEAFANREWVPVDFVYIGSRVLTLVVIICEIIAVVAPLDDSHCNTLIHAITGLATATTCMGTYLFLKRARSVFFHSKWAKAVFTALWFIAVGGVISTTPFSFYGASVNPTGLCVVSKVSKIESVGSLCVAAFDITVFVTISYRVLVMERKLGRWAVVHAFFFGAKAGKVTRALLRTGQLYFFPMLVLMIFLLTFEFSSLVQGIFLLQCRAAAYCALAVSYNIMACRVFRLLRLVDPEDPWAPTMTEVSMLQFGQAPRGEETTFNITRF